MIGEPSAFGRGQIIRAAADPVARRVKLADNTDNMDLSRIANPTEKDFARLDEYKAVRQILLAAEPL